MSPIGQIRGTKVSIPNTVYTAIIAVALAVVLTTAAFAAFKCFTQYGTIFTTP
jgi:hypothetical protein